MSNGSADEYTVSSLRIVFPEQRVVFSTIVGNAVQSNQLSRTLICTRDIVIGSWDKFSTPNLKYTVSFAPHAKYTVKRRRFRFFIHEDIVLKTERAKPAIAISVVMFNWSVSHFRFTPSPPFPLIVARWDEEKQESPHEAGGKETL